MNRIKQGVARLFALSFPLTIVLVVRFHSSDTFGNLFFEILTDLIVIVSFLKLGVDVYLPSATTVYPNVYVSELWKISWIVIGVLCCLIGIYLYVNNYAEHIIVVACFVSTCLMLAEIHRLNNRFVIFYMLKSPAVYFAAILLALSLYGVYSLFWLKLVCVLAIVFCFSLVKSNGKSRQGNSVILAVVLSVLVVISNWKEAMASRYLFDSFELGAIVMYTRFMILITFLYMLNNAAVPGLLKERNKWTASQILKLAGSNRTSNTIWAILCAAIILIYVKVVEPKYFFGVAMLYASSVILVWVGNITMCMVCVRMYKELIYTHVLSIILFSFIVILFFGLGNDAFISICFATLVHQIVSLSAQYIFLQLNYSYEA